MRPPPSLRTTRRVWAAVSDEPQCSVRSLADQLGLATSTVALALQMLRDAGYIRQAKYCTGRTIVVPFITKGPQ